MSEQATSDSLLDLLRSIDWDDLSWIESTEDRDNKENTDPRRGRVLFLTKKAKKVRKKPRPDTSFHHYRI